MYVCMMHMTQCADGHTSKEVNNLVFNVMQLNCNKFTATNPF